MEPTADHVVLISAPGPEHLALALVFGIAVVAGFFSAAMAWRGKVEGWSLLGLFGLVATAAGFALAHMPTRVEFGRAGAEIGYGAWHDKRDWTQLAGVDAQRLWGGLRLRFTHRDVGGGLPWSQWPGVYVPNDAIEPRDLTMRIEAWRLPSGRAR